MLAPLKMFRLLIAIFMIVGVGLGAGAWKHRRVEEEMLGALRDTVRRGALAFLPEELRALQGVREDLQTPAYRAVKDRLLRLRPAHGRAAHLYVVRLLPGDGAVYLADAEPADSPEVVSPGDPFAEAAAASRFRVLGKGGERATDGPLVELSDDWAKGYALIADHGSGPESGPRDILGLTMPAAQVRRSAFAAGAGASAAVWLAGAFLLGLVLARRRHSVLDRQVRKLAAALEQSHAAAMIVGRNNRIEYANAGMCLLTGYSRQDLVGRDWRMLKAPDMPEPPFGEMLQSVHGGHSWTGRWTSARQDGTTYPVRSILSPLKGDRGEPAGFIAVFDDMTALAWREAELCAAKEHAQAGEHAKDQFLATMSHEVRTPLNGIVGFTSLLLDTPLTPEQREYVQTIRVSSEALIHLTTEILDFSDITAGRLQLEFQPCDPRRVVDDALEIFAGTAAEKHLELLHRVAAEVPARIRTDPVRLRQILIALIGNAVKFTPAGEVEVAVRRVDGWLEWVLRDTGPGIAAEDMDRVFEPFSQVDSSATRRFGGLGLGLAISRSLVQALGGEIAIKRGGGQGTTFAIRLPLEELQPPPARGERLAGRRLALVVEHPGLRTELSWLAGEWGATAVDCGLADLAQASWDLALVDADAKILAALNPWPDSLAGWRAAHVFCLVPVALPAETRRMLRSRFRALLNKPVRHAGLQELLVEALTAAPTVPLPAERTSLALRVLIAEDNRVNQTLLQHILDTLDCEWVTVPNGRRAVEELAIHAYDVVLMDLHMPELDGISATRQIRAGEAGAAAREVWIAILSADARSEQRERAFTAGVNDYLQKPVTLADVETALLRHRDERRQAMR
ncbi:MAG TPA: ATP-binding protein [Opitutaceae bacterium]